MEISDKDGVRRHVLDAFARGQSLSLDHCVYGPATGGTRGYINETMPYYRLLAGHLALTGAARVLEIGTHYGGSTLAMLEGLRAGGAQEPLLVTMDVTLLNEERLAREPEVRRLTGDARDPRAIETARLAFDDDAIDLVYIDALKEPAFVLAAMDNVARAGLRPTWIILDDVQTNDAMRRFWDVLEADSPEATLLISRDFPHMRKPEMGFGIIHAPGTRGMLGRCEQLLLASGGGRLAAAAEDTTARAREAGDGAFMRAHPGLPLDESAPSELDYLHHLASQVYSGEGEIVETGAMLGATTLALLDGLGRNDRVAQKRARLTSIDHFRHENASFDKYIEGRVELGASMLPAFFETVKGHEGAFNVIDMALNTYRWCGKPVELLVLGAMRSPQALAHAMREFAPCLSPGRGIVLVREILKPVRPWAAYGFLSLADHFELLHADASFAAFALKTPVAGWKLSRLVQNDFDLPERLRIVTDQAEQASAFPRYQFGLFAQAARMARKAEMNEEAATLLRRAASVGAEDIETRIALEKALAALRKGLGLNN